MRRFFTPDVCAAGRLQTSCYPIGENAFAYFSSGAALASGMVGKNENSVDTGSVNPDVCAAKEETQNRPLSPQLLRAAW